MFYFSFADFIDLDLLKFKIMQIINNDEYNDTVHCKSVLLNENRPAMVTKKDFLFTPPVT